MILAIDVKYNEDTAQVAGVLFESWHSHEPRKCILKTVSDIAPYEPGAFYKRELPCILTMLEDLNEDLEAIVVDGYVTLGVEKKTGLGMHLYEALQKAIPIIGVAKTRFMDTPKVCEVYRGKSLNPLFVTAVGITQGDANSNITSMHGPNRIPTLLKQADQLCRGIKV